MLMKFQVIQVRKSHKTEQFETQALEEKEPHDVTYANYSSFNTENCGPKFTRFQIRKIHKAQVT